MSAHLVQGWRLARRELRGGLSALRIVLACLALGVAAIAAVGTLRAGIEAGLQADGAKLLGGDLEVRVSQRPVDAAARAARRLGYDAVIRTAAETSESADAVGGRLVGEAATLLAAAARDGRPRAVLEGGEAVVTVPADHGTGGRNQQTALAAAAAWPPGAAWPAGLLIASLATDGEDGPTDAAGGMVDGEIAKRLLEGGDLPRAVARCDAYPALAAAGGLVRTGPTGTNVADVRIILARP